MRSFTQSLSAARRMEIQIQAAFLADRLMNELEIKSPPEGMTQGSFEDENALFSYRVTMTYEDPDYGKVDGDDNIEQFFPVRRLEIEIDYDDKAHTPFQALKMQTALLGFEKFSYPSKQSYANF
jgi:hypothetical protein